jgi:DNA-binding MarR family transcriptional regulator
MDIARDEVDDIGSWRDATADRDKYSTGDPRAWGKMPPGWKFHSETVNVAAWLTACYPKLDPSPLFDISKAVEAWYQDHNANRISPQPVLLSKLDDAANVLRAVRDGIQLKSIYVPEAEKPAGDVSLTPEGMTILETLARENAMTVTQEDLADATKLSLPTVRKALKYLREHDLTNRPHGPRKGDAITEAGRAILARR